MERELLHVGGAGASGTNLNVVIGIVYSLLAMPTLLVAILGVVGDWLVVRRYFNRN